MIGNHHLKSLVTLVLSGINGKGLDMYAVTRMSGRLLAMETVNTLDDLYLDEDEFLRVQTLINEGTPVIFCEDLDDLMTLFPNLQNSTEKVEVIYKDEDTGDSI